MLKMRTTKFFVRLKITHLAKELEKYVFKACC